MRSRVLMLGALLATAALLAACSADPPPLGTSGPDAGGNCDPLAVGQLISDGFSILHNASTSRVTINSVKLPSSSHGLAITKAWLMPLYKSPRGGLDYAGAQNWPPVAWGTWPQRQAVPGAVIKPRQTLNLVFGISRTGPKDGRTPGPVITYTAGRNTYTLRQSWGYAIVVPGTHCPSSM